VKLLAMLEVIVVLRATAACCCERSSVVCKVRTVLTRRCGRSHEQDLLRLYQRYCPTAKAPCPHATSLLQQTSLHSLLHPYVIMQRQTIPSRPIPSCTRDDWVAIGHVLCICILTHISIALSRPQLEGVCALAADR
jgi:hypothetical protein